jgi:hypothetical protein
VPLPDRGQAEAAVVLGLHLTADTEEAEVEQAQGRAQRPLAGHAGEVFADGLARPG